MGREIENFEVAARGHWSEGSMHWHLDVTFREDKNRTLDKTHGMKI
jgi:predicted transposase YbfD/YdcC